MASSAAETETRVLAEIISTVASSVTFGYLVGYSGNYDVPFIPMVATLSLGAFLWLKIDPTHQLFDEPEPALVVPVAGATTP